MHLISRQPSSSKSPAPIAGTGSASPQQFATTTVSSIHN